jgi:maleylpyruvate isomerase
MGKRHSVLKLYRYVRGSAADRARVRALALAIACDIHPLNDLRVLKYLATMPDAQPDAA